MESDHTSDDWDVLSQSSVHSISSLQSSQSAVSSIVEINRLQIEITESKQPSAFIPQINEENELNANNELIPSYVDIQSELQRQRQIINELKSQLNEVTNERDQIRSERDVQILEVERLRQRNDQIVQANAALQQMNFERRQKGRKCKKIKSKSVKNTNRKGHRSSVPAKLRFRRQRTTHRTIFCRQRNW